MGSPVYGLAFNRGVAAGVGRGIQIGLKMAADAAAQRRLQIANGALKVVQYATPVVLTVVRSHREKKVIDAAA